MQLNSSHAAHAAEFFLEHGQLPKAVQLLVLARQYDHALDLCTTQNIPLTEVRHRQRPIIDWQCAGMLCAGHLQREHL